MSLTPDKEAELAALTEKLGIQADEELYSPVKTNREVYDRLVKIVQANDQIDFLDEQIDLHSDAAEDKRVQARKAAMEHYGREFQDFNWKAALAGGNVDAKISVAGVSDFLLRVPNGSVTDEVDKFVRGLKDPVREEEKIALAWVVGVHNTAAGAQPVQLLGQTLEARLSQLRAWPRLVIDAVADRCITLNTWLQLVLEDQLGNS